MTNAKEELKRDIEQARERLDSSIERRENYDAIYQNSVELDRLIELYQQGIFARHNISPKYITDFADTIYTLSNRKIKLNLSKMNEIQ